MIGIYRIWNRYNGKSYIGQSIDIEKRIYAHYHKTNFSKDDWHKELKYSPERFNWEILELCPQKNLNEREIYWIKQFNSLEKGYNIQTPSLNYSYKCKEAVNNIDVFFNTYENIDIFNWNNLC